MSKSISLKAGHKKGSLVIESGIIGAGPNLKASKITTHGGPRKGAGRKVGSKNKNAKGRTAVTRSVSMQPESWQKLDRDRGDLSRGKYIESKL